MLLVRTYLDKSSIHGIGLFSAEFIKTGTKIYEIDDFTKQYTEDEYETITKDPLKKIFLDTYAWKYKNIYYLSLDNDRFMNHSDNPNTYETSFATFALTDIKSGEEITCNYNMLFI